MFAAVWCRCQGDAGCRSVDFVAVFVGNAAAVGFKRAVAAVGIAQFYAFCVQQVGIAARFGQLDIARNGFGGIACLVGQSIAFGCRSVDFTVFSNQGNVAAIDGRGAAVGIEPCAVQTLQIFGKFDVERTVKVV